MVDSHFSTWPKLSPRFLETKFPVWLWPNPHVPEPNFLAWSKVWDSHFPAVQMSLVTRFATVPVCWRHICYQDQAFWSEDVLIKARNTVRHNNLNNHTCPWLYTDPDSSLRLFRNWFCKLSCVLARYSRYCCIFSKSVCKLSSVLAKYSQYCSGSFDSASWPCKCGAFLQVKSSFLISLSSVF